MLSEMSSTIEDIAKIDQKDNLFKEYLYVIWTVRLAAPYCSSCSHPAFSLVPVYVIRKWGWINLLNLLNKYCDILVKSYIIVPAISKYVYTASFKSCYVVLANTCLLRDQCHTIA
jgi:hypothetical protein